MTTQELMNMPVKGNFHDDSAVWDAATKIATDTTRPTADRLLSLKKMNELTGCDDPCTEEALQEFMEDVGFDSEHDSEHPEI